MNYQKVFIFFTLKSLPAALYQRGILFPWWLSTELIIDCSRPALSLEWDRNLFGLVDQTIMQSLFFFFFSVESVAGRTIWCPGTTDLHYCPCTLITVSSAFQIFKPKSKQKYLSVVFVCEMVNNLYGDMPAANISRQRRGGAPEGINRGPSSQAWGCVHKAQHALLTWGNISQLKNKT